MVRYPALLHSIVISYLQNENVTVLEKVKLKLYGQAVFRISNGLALLDPALIFNKHLINFPVQYSTAVPCILGGSEGGSSYKMLRINSPPHSSIWLVGLGV